MQGSCNELSHVTNIIRSRIMLCETMVKWNFSKSVTISGNVLIIDLPLCRFYHVHDLCNLAGICAAVLRNGQPCTTANYQYVGNNQLISKCDSRLSLLTKTLHYSGSPRT